MAIFRLDGDGAAAAVGPLEAEILNILWGRGEASGVPEVHRAIHESGRKLSYSAVKAVLNNLAAKKLLRKEKRGRITYFEPLQTREEFDSRVLSGVISSLKRNYGQPVIAQFVDQLAVDEETLQEFERLIAERRSGLR